MSNLYPENTSGTFHVRDCQLWAEIDYLDSPTDYREFLPGQRARADMPDRSEFVMLETQNQSPKRAGTRVSVVVMVMVSMLIFLLICGCFFHLFLNAF